MATSKGGNSSSSNRNGSGSRGPGGGSLSAPARTAASSGGQSRPTSSASIGSKGGGASSQRAGSGGNAGMVNSVARANAQTRNTISRMATASGGAISNQAARIGAISRGAGLSLDPRSAAMTAVNAFGETPAGIRAAGLVSGLARSALNNERLFNVRGATPEQQALVDRIGPTTLNVAARTRLDPRTIIGQAMFESGKPSHPSGMSGLARNYNNLFGYKVGSGANAGSYGGSVANLKTTEYVNGRPVRLSQPFRAYSSPEQSVEDYGDLISRRYSSAANFETPEQQLAAIRSRGYATHPAASYVNSAARMASRISPGAGEVATIAPASYSVASAPAPTAQPDAGGPSLWSNPKGWLSASTGVNVDNAINQARQLGAQASEGIKTVANYQSNPFGRAMLAMAGAGNVAAPRSGGHSFARSTAGVLGGGGKGTGNSFDSNAVMTQAPSQMASQFDPAPPQQQMTQPTYAWSFPQYYSSWAFTPPTPPVMSLPPRRA